MPLLAVTKASFPTSRAARAWAPASTRGIWGDQYDFTLRLLLARLTSRSMSVTEVVEEPTEARARPTITSVSSRVARLVVSGVGAAMAERAARGAMSVARAVRRIVEDRVLAGGLAGGLAGWTCVLV